MELYYSSKLISTNRNTKHYYGYQDDDVKCIEYYLPMNQSAFIRYLKINNRFPELYLFPNTTNYNNKIKLPYKYDLAMHYFMK